MSRVSNTYCESSSCFDILYSFMVLGQVQGYCPALLHGFPGSNCQCRKVEERKYFYFTTLIVTRDDVNEYMKYHAEYTKANRFKDIVCKIYI